MAALGAGSAVFGATRWPGPGPQQHRIAVGAEAPLYMPTAPAAYLPGTEQQSGGPTVTSAHCVDVPILLYHYIRVNPNARDRTGFMLSVPPAAFQAQMDWLHLNGVHTVTLEQVAAALDGKQTLPPHAIVITFDDGHDDFATRAVPLLLREHFVATTFVVPGFLGTSSYMTEAP